MPRAAGIWTARGAIASASGQNRQRVTVWDQIWPLAVAGALSPSITVIVLALLMRPDRPRTRVLVFWLGAVVAMLVWAILISSALWGS